MYYSVPMTPVRARRLPLYLWTVGQNHEQEPIHRPDGAGFYHLYFVSEGELCLQSAQGEAVYPAGTALFLPKAMPMSYRAAKDRLVSGWLTFDGEAVSALTDYFGIDGICAAPAQSLLPQLEVCIKAVLKNQPQERLSALAYGLLITFFSLSHPQSAHLETARAYIKEHYAEDLSVAQIARAAQISPSLLYRLFKKEHTTPIAYLHSLRIDTAKHRLLVSNDSVARIGEECGFHDRAYFCKIFRRLVGLSPNEFRREYR